mgnify:CR=1 FL=1|jgi:hypothetical protein
MDIFCENSQFNYLKHTLIENYNESILTEIILLYSVMYLKFFPVRFGPVKELSANFL